MLNAGDSRVVALKNYLHHIKLSYTKSESNATYCNGYIVTIRQLCAYCSSILGFFLNKYVYTTVLLYDIVAVDDEINLNSFIHRNAS